MLESKPEVDAESTRTRSYRHAQYSLVKPLLLFYLTSEPEGTKEIVNVPPSGSATAVVRQVSEGISKWGFCSINRCKPSLAFGETLTSTPDIGDTSVAF